MTIVRHATADAFLAATMAYRASEPLLTNIMGSVAVGVAHGRGYESEMWLTIEDPSGAVVGIAMRTAPWNLAVSDMPAWAAGELGEFVLSADPGVPGVNGPRDVVDVVLDAFPSDRDRHVAMTDVLYSLTDLLEPSGVPGSGRRAVEKDRDLLVSWHVQFGEDAGLPLHDVEESLDARVADGALWLWEVEGRAVSMGGHAPVVDGPGGAVARIGPVYTPDRERGHGYAAAITALIVRDLAPRCAQIMLYADADNGTANRLYQRLGFSRATEIVETVISPAIAGEP